MKTKSKSVKKTKAQLADDRMAWSCNMLVDACTAALRTGEDKAISEACKPAMVCATVCAAHFSYYDEASLAARIGACNELATCCETLLAAIDGKSFDDLETATEDCLRQC